MLTGSHQTPEVIVMPLIVTPPSDSCARLRFVAEKSSLVSRVIGFGTAGPVSHVEAVMLDGTIIASHIGSGVAVHPIDYDTYSTLQIIVDLPMEPEMIDKWEDFLRSRVGWKYDSPAIVGFVTHFNFHKPGELVCSALQVDALRHCGWWPIPLASRYHQISPVVMLLMLQADPRSVVHHVETV